MRRSNVIIVLAGVLFGGCGPGSLDAVRLDPSSLVTGQVAHWTFDEGAGTVVTDVSQNGHDGQLTGGSWTSDGKFGGALEFASGNYVTVFNFPQATAAWTVSVWLRMTAEQRRIGKAEADWVTILSNENVFSGGWQVHVDSRAGFDRFDVAYWGGSTVNDYVVASCMCIDVDTWIHLTAVFDHVHARAVIFYRDDTVVDRRPMPTPILPGDATLYMGRWNGAVRFLTARIDDFTIWNRALSRAEIGLLSLQPAPAPP